MVKFWWSSFFNNVVNISYKDYCGSRFNHLCDISVLQYSRMNIFDISIEISAKYQISATTETKSVMEIRLREKSQKNRKFCRYFADISVSDRNFDCGTHARMGDFLFQNIEGISKISVKYRRYIGNIGKNIEDISGYIGNISGYIGNISKWPELKS